jgi:hypothetical protein
MASGRIASSRMIDFIPGDANAVPVVCDPATVFNDLGRIRPGSLILSERAKRRTIPVVKPGTREVR